MLSLKTSEEFVTLLPHLTDEESAKLEQSLKLYGCRDAITIWKEQQVIIDGHNRYEFCQKNNIEFKTEEFSFASKDDVKLWMLRNQLSRRNINTFHRTRAQLQITDLENKQKSESEQSESEKESNDESAKSKNVINQVATEAGVTTDMVRKVKYLEDNVEDKVKDKLMRGETSISKEYQNLREKERSNKDEKPSLPDSKMPIIKNEDALSFLQAESSQGTTFDLLLTEPPSYDEWKANGSIDEFISFYTSWLSKAIELLHDKSRIFIFADMNVKVLHRIIEVCNTLSNDKIKFEDLLIWTFKPNLKEPLKHDFRPNFQSIIYFKGTSAEGSAQRTLNSVLPFMKDINNDFKFKQWRKPIFLLRKLMQMSVPDKGSMLDPFAGSGHFLINAAKSNIKARGCELNKEMFELALKSGCKQ